MTLRIPEAELEWSFSGPGGPGGQHANTANTRVTLVWDIENSVAPGPRQRALLLARFGPRVRIVAAGSRSQGRNREAALARLEARVAEALHVDPPRRATRPSRAARERRLQEKRRTSDRKRERRSDSDG
jgi:ribosome-associated protein